MISRTTVRLICTTRTRTGVGTTLSQLESRGLVRHKGQYWAINPKTYDAHTASVIGLQTVAEQFEGDGYDQNPDWAAELSDLEEQATDDESAEENTTSSRYNCE